MAVVDETMTTLRSEGIDNEKNSGTTVTPPGKQDAVESPNGSARVEAAAIEQDLEPQRTATGLKVSPLLLLSQVVPPLIHIF